MVLVSPSSVYIAGFHAHCVEHVDLVKANLTHFMGVCGQVGNQYEGHRLNDVTVRVPYGVAYNGNDKLYVSLITDSILLMIDLDTDIVTRIDRVPKRPKALQFDCSTNMLYMTATGGFLTYNLDTSEINVMDNTDFESDDKSLLSDPKDFITLSNHSWIIAESQQDR